MLGLIGLMGYCHNFCINWIHSKEEQKVLKNNSRLISALKERECSVDEDCEVRMQIQKPTNPENTKKIQKNLCPLAETADWRYVLLRLFFPARLAGIFHPRKIEGQNKFHL